MATQTSYGKNYGAKVEERTVFTQRELEEAYENHLQPNRLVKHKKWKSFLDLTVKCNN